MFVDKVKIRIKAGSGGNGAVAFRRESMLPRAAPTEAMAGAAATLCL